MRASAQNRSEPKARGHMSEIGKGVCAPPGDGLQANGPATRGAARAGLAQRDRSGRIGIGRKCPAGERRGACVVMDFCWKLCRRDTELGRKIDGRTAAQAVAAARKCFVVLMLMLRRCLSGVMRVLFRARLGMIGDQMKRGMGIAARKRERQQHDQTAQEQGSLHGMSTQLQRA